MMQAQLRSPYCGVEGSRHEHERQVGVFSARPCGGPFDGIDLLCVRCQIVQRRILAQAPDLCCVIV